MISMIAEAVAKAKKYGTTPNTVELSPANAERLRETFGYMGGPNMLPHFIHVQDTTLFVRALDIAPADYIYVLHNPEFDWWFRRGNEDLR